MKKVFVFSLALVFISLTVLAGSAEWPGPVHLFAEAPAVLSISEPYVPRSMPGESMAMRPNVGMMIMGGVLGNILGTLAGLYLGTCMWSSDDDELWTLFLGWGAGSTLGSATGASLAGYSRDWKGSWGMATVGAALGVGLSWLIISNPTFQENAGILSLAPLLLLPPIGAALGFNSSLRSRSLRAGNGLLNLAEGKLGVGVPDVQVVPSFVPGRKAKPGLQFNVRILSVEL